MWSMRSTRNARVCDSCSPGRRARKLRRGDVDLLGGRAVYPPPAPVHGRRDGGGLQPRGALRFGLLPLVVAPSTPRTCFRPRRPLPPGQECSWKGWCPPCRRVRAISGGGDVPPRFPDNVRISRASADRAQRARATWRCSRTCSWPSACPSSRGARPGDPRHPKFYLFDSGVYRLPPAAGAAGPSFGVGGAALEGLVAEHLRAWASHRLRARRALRTSPSGAQDRRVEVDFVVYAPRSSRRSRSRTPRGSRPRTCADFARFDPGLSRGASDVVVPGARAPKRRFFYIGNISFTSIMAMLALYSALISVIYTHHKLNALHVSGLVILTITLYCRDLSDLADDDRISLGETQVNAYCEDTRASNVLLGRMFRC